MSNKLKKRKQRISLIFIVYISLIFFIIFFFSSNINETENYVIFNIRADYFQHYLMFLPWMFFVSVFKIRKLWWFIVGILLASLAEFAHYFIEYRTFNIYDLIANISGIISGLIFFLIFNLITSSIKLNTK